MRTLDKTKPWFSVHGGASGAAFEQDGCLFGLDGNEIVTAERVAAVTVDPPAEQQPAIASAADEKGSEEIERQENDQRLADEAEAQAEAKTGSDEKPVAAEAPAKKTPGRKKQPAAAEAPASAIDAQIAAQAGA